MANKQLWILTGGNGAGKSTFYRQVLQPMEVPFINADHIAQDIYPDDPQVQSYAAARIAERMRMEQLQAGNSFCFETVFSHTSKIDFIAQAKAYSYEVILVFIHAGSPDVNIARVSQRAKEGGHNVPVDKIISRIPRTLANVKTAIPLCDEVWVLDNSRVDNPYQPVVTMKNGLKLEANISA